MKLTILKGYRNPEIENSHPLCSGIATFGKNVCFMQGGEPGRRQRHASPGGTLKIIEISIFFEKFSNGLWEAAGTPKWSQELLKEPKRGPEWSLSEPSGTTFGLKATIFGPC